MTQALAPAVAVPTRGNGIFLWAIGGVTLLLLQATFRLSQIAWEALSSGSLTTLEQSVCALWVLSNCYMEGYRGFQKRFVPRVLARAHYLATHPEPKLVFFAPLFAMAYFRAQRGAKIAAYAVTSLVVVAIVVVRGLPQPWRGIIDAGVVAGLSWGLIALLFGAAQRLSGKDPTSDPQLSVDSARQAILETAADSSIKTGA